MKRRASRELFDYWNAVRRGRLAPTGASFDPSAVREAMREGFYLDMSGDAFGRFTWVGADLRRGLPDARREGLFIDVWSRDAAPEAMRLLRLARRPCPVIAGAWGAAGSGAARVVEALVLPLLPDPRAPESARLIGVFAGVDPNVPLDRLDGMSSFRILDDSATPWRDAGFSRRRARAGWSAEYAELARRAQAELGARLAVGAEPQAEARGAGDEAMRVARHLTVIDGGKVAEKSPT